MGARPEKNRGRRIALKDWVGRTFGSLTVVAYDGRRGGKHYWRCRCLCGGSAVVSQSNLQAGHTKSCGCLSDPMGTRHFVEGTCIESIRSRRVSASNQSGIRGVYRNRRTGRWAAQITFQGRTRYLGSFDSLEEAARARAEAERVFDEFLERQGDAGKAAGAPGQGRKDAPVEGQEGLLAAAIGSGAGPGMVSGVRGRRQGKAEALPGPDMAAIPMPTAVGEGGTGGPGGGEAVLAAAGGAYGQEA